MGRKKPLDPNRIAVVTVHGTGDTAAGADGEKWFQNGSAFVGRLKARLGVQGVKAEVIPFHWSGENSVLRRELSANKLAKALREYAKTFASVHVIGHSHGGNVANDALNQLNWMANRKTRQRVSSMTSVGTPFFKAQFGVAEGIIGVAFLTLLVSTIGLLVAALAIYSMFPTMHGDAARYVREFEATALAAGRTVAESEAVAYAQDQVESASLYKGTFTAISAFLPLSALTLLPLLPLVLSGTGNLLRYRRKKHDDAKFFSIWHPNDEAIAFLQGIETARVDAFPRWALWRGSRRSAVLGSAVFVFGAFALAALVIGVGVVGFQITDAHYEKIGNIFGFDGLAIFGGLTTGDLGLLIFLFAVLGAPLIFLAVYLVFRFLFGLVAEIVGRDWLNSSVNGALRGMAFGRDGFVGVGNVSTQSHTYGVRPFVLSGVVAERMREGAASAATALLDRYRWSLLNVGADHAGAISELATDAMTWKCLIHTSYFEQPEVADAIGDYIAEHVERERAR